MKKLEDILLDHARIYPKLQPEDMVKLIYQNEFASGHMIPDETTSLAMLKNECSALPSRVMAAPVFEDIGNNLCRLYLSGDTPDMPGLDTLNRFFIYTSNTKKGDMNSFIKKLSVLEDLCSAGALPFTTEQLTAYLNGYKENGYPVVSHSAVYREQYTPHYRVVDKCFYQFYDVFSSLNGLLSMGKTVVTAIDGNSGSGKSWLAELISHIFDCNLIHMDDFFLTPEMRTEKRLAEPGGNVDYARFKTQVMDRIKTHRNFTYQIFDCGLLEFTESPVIPVKQLYIIEGVYSMHTMFRGDYDFSVFLSTDVQTAHHRILHRNGDAMLRRFINEWIPLENLYFQEMRTASACDLIIDTSALH